MAHKTRKKPTPPQNRLSRNHTECSDSKGYVEQLNRRRAASRRMTALESGRHDPWKYEPPTCGYPEAAAHLLSHGLMPAPNIVALQTMWRSGGNELKEALAIVEYWREASA